MSTISLNQKCSKVVGTSSDIFGDIQKSSENSRKSSEVAGTFSEIRIEDKEIKAIWNKSFRSKGVVL